ncbi:ThiF family adenylyltransferase [Bacillus cereus]|uniref:ThiF family adenylyltransferase n=1 Tax=Bacillus cereus group TaxID=86661 RepID=UPI000BEE2139|nr:MULTISPECIES: ThiF family adenylyltransferase [Bacillus cereus group]MCU4733659.1 ThiF family adenylyltransferase [Bacillus cereus]PEE08374.1 thiamine biosynthesis protein ThiF [Bacillus cereus]PEQ27754.1 thiamine biosynthesis protein ThiF [Bacillus thuringiensis]PEY26360.1 thiamine biosynthesis protein ThiF [Bacillus cereus]PFV26833.1 thiamine biosynthesis protein ThiF [Bacillus thuringiensis]
MSIIIDIAEGKKIVPHIVVVGTGANGSLILQSIAQMVSIFKLNGEIVAADPDVVESKNLGNQHFVLQDIGKYKADVLRDRYTAAYKKPHKVNISSFTSSYIEDIETLGSLYKNKYKILEKEADDNYLYLPILIGAVDNMFSREVFHQYFNQCENLIYIDVGNTAVTVPTNWRERDKKHWTPQQLKDYKNSGYNGQVVCGIKRNGEVILPPLGDLFPDAFKEKETAPSQLSCSELAASEPQRVITNKFAALSVSQFVNELFDEGTVSNHYIIFHAQKAFMKAAPIGE